MSCFHSRLIVIDYWCVVAVVFIGGTLHFMLAKLFVVTCTILYFSSDASFII